MSTKQPTDEQKSARKISVGSSKTDWRQAIEDARSVSDQWTKRKVVAGKSIDNALPLFKRFARDGSTHFVTVVSLAKVPIKTVERLSVSMHFMSREEALSAEWTNYTRSPTVLLADLNTPPEEIALVSGRAAQDGAEGLALFVFHESGRVNASFFKPRSEPVAEFPEIPESQSSDLISSIPGEGRAPQDFRKAAPDFGGDHRNELSPAVVRTIREAFDDAVREIEAKRAVADSARKTDDMSDFIEQVYDYFTPPFAREVFVTIGGAERGRGSGKDAPRTVALKRTSAALGAAIPEAHVPEGSLQDDDAQILSSMLKGIAKSLQETNEIAERIASTSSAGAFVRKH